MKNLICTECGNETQYNFGDDHKIPICRNCAKRDQNKIAKERDTAKTSTSKLLSIFSGVFITLGVIGGFIAAGTGNIIQGIYVLSSGVIIMLFLDALSEIIIQLSMLNKKMQKD